MSRSDIEQVLRNWIAQALSPMGDFAEGIDPTKWIADNFIDWWSQQVEDSLSSAELAAHPKNFRRHPATQRRVMRETLDRIGYISDVIVSERTGRILDDFLRGLRRLPSAGHFAYFVLLTIVYWSLNGLGVLCMLQAFDIPIDTVGAYAMMACVVVGMMIPNSPGNVGSFWYFLCLPVALYGLSDSAPQIIAFGLSVWLMQLLQQSLFGLYFIARGQVTWKGVVDATHEDETSLAEPTDAAPDA